MPEVDPSQLPDFDSMSQEELVAWLEHIARLRSDLAAKFLESRADSDAEPDLKDWENWLDDAALGDAAQDPPLTDGDTPAGLPRLNENETAPVDPLDWLEELATAEKEASLPEITDYQPPDAEDLQTLLSQYDGPNPLTWLDDLRRRANSAPQSHRSPPPPADDYDDDIDEAYEDDEVLDDLEDESLYSLKSGSTQAVLDSLTRLMTDEAGSQTESMAPLPADVEPRDQPIEVVDGADSPQAPTRVELPADPLLDAYLQRDHQAELEAWYAERLRQISAMPESGNDQLIQRVADSKPPPPGLAAAINSARGKIESDQLREALRDYETLLHLSAGLDWVVSDMRALIAREEFQRNPSVHRVLGDALMRQGHLDDALDTYRHALSLI